MIELNKIYNEDCLETMKRMDDNSIDLIITSPPYNYGGFSRNGRKLKYDVYNDNMNIAEYKLWIKKILTECARVLKHGCSMYWNHKGKYENHEYMHSFWIIDLCPLTLSQHIIWKFPSSPDVAKIKWYPRKEDIYYFTKGTPKYFNETMAKLTDVWQINHMDINNTHPAPFPISLSERCILASTIESDIIYDPFMGSGTTAIASIKEKRKWIGSEISKEYCEIAEKRIQPYINQQTLFKG